MGKKEETIEKQRNETKITLHTAEDTACYMNTNMRRSKTEE